MIMILTCDRDSHADRVEAGLRERAAPFLRFDPKEVPVDARLSMTTTPGGRLVRAMERGGTRIDLAGVRAVWYRRPGAPTPSARIGDPKAKEFVEYECSLLLQDFWHAMEAVWLPGRPLDVRRAEYKGLQLSVAERLGFELPPTLTTSCPDELVDFYRRHGGQIVSKQAETAFQSTIYPDHVRYTELVTTRDIAHCGDLGLCPMTFQAYVPKRLELRITVVGRRAFAAEIHSQQNAHTRFDWRRYDMARTRHSPHVLPPDVERRCIELVAQLGLRYGAVDIILTPDGRYVFLEINPNGQYRWIELHTDLPISDAICDLLIDGDADAK